MRMLKGSCCLMLLSFVLAGCGGVEGPPLYKAGGTVKYKNAPLSGATVTLVPAKGPVAMGVTDAEGKFKLITGASQGAVEGPAKVAVSAAGTGGESSPVAAVTKPSNAEQGRQQMEKMAQSQYGQVKGGPGGPEKPKSMIPEKYAKPDTSGLTVTVSKDESKNNFELKLE